uniref:hypothetical protein n=1 Tax=Mycobacterium avium TaxID=1764 RepID=UPI000A6ECD6D
MVTVSLKKQASRAQLDTSDVVSAIPDDFGRVYGLDYDGRYRDRSYIGTLDPRVYQQ